MTKIEIENGLMQLGVTAGMMLEVHSSLSSLGYVDGGALMVIDALKHIVGRGCEIIQDKIIKRFHKLGIDELKGEEI